MPYQKSTAVAAEISAAKFNAPAIQALRLVGRRGYKNQRRQEGRRVDPLCREAGGRRIMKCLVAASLGLMTSDQ
jgi:hypothetical protein